MRSILFLFAIAAVVAPPYAIGGEVTEANSDQLMVLCNCLQQSADATTCTKAPVAQNGATLQTPARAPNAPATHGSN